MLCMNDDCFHEMELIYENKVRREYRCPKCGETAVYYPEYDMDTQPIPTIVGEPTYSADESLTIRFEIEPDNGDDTIILPRKAEEP